MKGGAGGEGPQYDEIPYGDVGPPMVAEGAAGGAVGHSGKGQLPEVPADYSQVPELPQRQGETYPRGYTIYTNLILFSVVNICCLFNCGHKL